MEKHEVKEYFRHSGVVDEYSDAVQNVGLWNSEKMIIENVFPYTNANLIEIGCGAGRIAIHMRKLGYSDILGLDISDTMIAAARKNAKKFHVDIPFEVGDATNLRFEDDSFDGAIFGFNGLMQIPRRGNRFLAIKEILRILTPGSPFFFTTHDRDTPHRRWYWQKEKKRWAQGSQQKELIEFGDRCYETPQGMLFIHIPTRQSIIEDFTKAGFEHIFDAYRSEIADESIPTQEFSDECRFWVFRKP